MRSRFPNLTDWLALFFAVTAVVAAYFVEDRVYERMAHLEDEMAYVWQAQAIAGGDLLLPSPPNPKSFMTPFVIDYNGFRFGKYPPGWPIALAFGFFTGLEDWINPILAGVGIWLLYSLSKRITTGPISLLAVLLMLTSPMFWLLSGSVLSHAWSLVLTLGFILAWLDTFDRRGRLPLAPRWLTIFIAGLSLGILVLTRPMSAIGVAFPFFIHGIILLVRGDKSTRIRVLTIGLLTILFGSLLFVWQFIVTGDPLLNPYTLWWKYDKIGFGEGYGRWGEGHTLDHVKFIIEYSLWLPNGSRNDLLGWENLWPLFLPFGLWALRKKPSAWLAAGILPALILAYVPYWIGSWGYGPRYYYEGMLTITILTAAGIFWLAGNGMRVRKVLVGLSLTVLVGYNLLTYLPDRLRGMYSMYNINRAMLEPFYTVAADEIQPALILVHQQNEWTEYGGLLELQNAQLSTPFIFALYRMDSEIADYNETFPERQIFHYYPNDPFEFYKIPR